MPRKRKDAEAPEQNKNNPNVMGLRAEIMDQPIVETLEENYMPYAMSVIVSRAIPEIDGFKPAHRKLLYTMYKMGLLTGGRTKSANIVGQTMRLNPHGDAAIYETMVRLSRGYAALLTPFVDSKGNFGKVFSRDMSYAASRYTEAKLSPIASELFREINSDTVDFVDNYDSTTKEPTLLPTTFPNVLVSANTGIAVGMASNICSFNLEEV
ncbi:MAG: topoisomerase IV, partial [Oscillospiraceae bacterium]|nr:topoisomerase IV [Oscillospiraceae bacterium]